MTTSSSEGSGSVYVLHVPIPTEKNLSFTGFPSSVRHLVVPAGRVTKNRMGFAQVTQSSWRSLKMEKVPEID